MASTWLYDSATTGGLYTAGTTTNTATCYSTLALQQRELEHKLRQQIRQEERDLAEQYRSSEQYRPSKDHHWSEDHNAWIYVSPYADKPYADKPDTKPPTAKKKNFFERLQAEVDEWIADVELVL